VTAATASAPEPALRWLDVPDGRAGVDAGGALAALRLHDPELDFVARPTGAGLLRLALPLPDCFSHYVETGTHGAPEITATPGGLRLTYAALATAEGPVPVRIEIDLDPDAETEGLRLRARVRNGTDAVIPQVVFPQLLGLGPVDGADGTRLQLGRGRMRPLRELSMRPDDAHFLQLPLQRYLEYGYRKPHNMKWLDYGSARAGVTLFSRDPRYHTTGVLVERPDRAAEAIDLRWAHYPHIAPGETWDSGDFVLLPHPGDWYAGARAYQRFTSRTFPYHAPRRVREALGVRTVWAAVRGARPAFPLSDVAAYAAEIADPALGLAELVLWHWWLRNGYPIFLDPRLGTEAEFREALDRCRALGVPVSLFVSHKLQRDTAETDPSWRFRNAAGQQVLSNWTYGPGFVPRFGPPFMGTHSMVQGSALSPGYRAEGLAEYRTIQEKYGPVSICFDQFNAWPQPDYNPGGDGRPHEEGERLLDFGRAARAIVHAADPEGSFSGEHVTENKVPVLDYTWEWTNGFEIEASAPFRYVFPHFRLNANVNEHPRGALLAFMEGALLNVMPGNMHSHRLRDCPELVATLKQLAALRRRFLPYFTEGQFRFREGLEVRGAEGRLYSHGRRLLVLAVNPTDAAVEADVRIDLRAAGGPDGPVRATAYGLSGEVLDDRRCPGDGLALVVPLGPDGLCAIEVAAPDAAPGGA
jgi:hypothetical protein